MEADLRAAVRAGFLVWRDERVDGVELRGRVVRYSPQLPDAERARRVLALIRAAGS